MKNLNEQNLPNNNAPKDEKAFYKRDIIVYIALILLIASLFLIFVLPANKNSDGFIVSRNGITLVSCYFTDESSIIINQDYKDLIEQDKTSDGYSVKIYTDSTKSAFNTIYFNIVERSAKVTESNCSERRDCYYAPKIKNNGSIYCSPHDLLIKPITDTASGPVVG